MIYGLRFFRCANAPRTWVLASFHSPRSLTWSWALSLSLFRSECAFLWPIAWLRPTAVGWQWGVRIPFVLLLSWQRQSQIPKGA
jgi:hypothetical protein